MTYAKWHYTDHNMSKMKTDRKVTIVLTQKADEYTIVPIGTIERVFYSEHFSDWPLNTVRICGKSFVVADRYCGCPSLDANKIMFELGTLPRDTDLLLGNDLETAIKVHI